MAAFSVALSAGLLSNLLLHLWHRLLLLWEHGVRVIAVIALGWAPAYHMPPSIQYTIYATSYTINHKCHIVYIILYANYYIHTSTMHTTFHLLCKDVNIILHMPSAIHTTHATYYIIYAIAIYTIPPIILWPCHISRKDPQGKRYNKLYCTNF